VRIVVYKSIKNMFIVVTGGSEVSVILQKLEQGVVGIATAHGGYIVAIVGGKDAQIGMIRSRLDAICSYFSRVFDQLK
jgi:energy-converting hydrogenase Eha subunit C